MNKYKNRIIIIMFFLIGIIGLNNKAYSAVLKQITATPSNVIAGNTVSYTVSFKTQNTIPNNGKITIQFPAGFNVSGATFTSWVGFDGGQTLTVASQTITITRNGTGSSSSGGLKTIVLGNIVNSSITADNYQVIVTTKNSTDGTIDGPTNSIYFRIASSHTETDIDGLYYIRSSPQTHYQNNGNTYGVGGYDVGILSRTPPSSNEERHCGAWVQYYLDENGTYSQTNQISNIYYYLWYHIALGTQYNGQSVIGYDTAGGADIVVDESFTETFRDSVAKTSKNMYRLYAGKQTFASPKDIPGNAIYNFTVKLTSEFPYVISTHEQVSFVIINLPDDVTLQSFDSDNDGLTDYDELFTYFTNPYDEDTEDDGYNDKFEVDNGLNPIDPEQSPKLGKFLVEYNGEASSVGFGSSISSIQDLDSDGKDDVIIGASAADPGGRLNAGSVYIYSSGNDSLIRQYDGILAGDGFGSSVHPISDMDGDGKEDLLISASNADPGGRSNAGSVYIYSSGDGSLIKQYDGSVSNAKLGFSISTISDLDDDGKEDVVLGALGYPNLLSGPGAVFVYSSGDGSLIRQYDGLASADKFGASVSSIQDMDDDGKEDVVIGATGADPGGRSGAGSVYIYSSGDGSLIRQYDGILAGDTFGSAISIISDMDSDGKEDLLISAYSTDPVVPDPGGNTLAGSVYIYSSGDGSLIRQYNGNAAMDRFGASCCSISDMNEDGQDDILIGSSGADYGTFIGAGLAYIYSSGDGSIPNQSWAKGSSKDNAFDLDDYFFDLNSLAIPTGDLTINYTASTADNLVIYVSIDADNKVSFSQPSWWAGTETVVFTATDSAGLSSQSNTVTLEVTGADDDNDYHCFIATAAYGTPVSDEVKVLRRFRNEYLLANPIGRGFVETYYTLSPKIAEFIKEHSILKSVVRNALNPLVWVSKKIAE